MMQSEQAPGRIVATARHNPGELVAGKENLMPDEPSTERPVLDLLATMTAASLEKSTLDAQSVMIARIAALVAVDAPPVSYLVNLGAAGEAGVDAETVQGVLIAVAPIVGTARVAAAAGKMVRALGLAIAVADAELEESEAATS
jgi:4-carboxymuconolactone decarboxylase